ncbi:MAG TPA: type II toxin-antitoxin system VapC family toxin [Bryobacteraceae bacterium]|nr:type II toxin-antitoxin system VapC family toxin [Bryobacteraceae bacterium]
MTPRFLLDTHVVVQWLSVPRKLTTDQLRVMREAYRHGEPVALSAYSLVEIAMLARGSRKIAGIDRIFEELETNPMFRILPITIPIAVDAGALNLLRDPGDRTIVATARVHGMRLLTSDQRIIDSKLVSVIE